MDDVGSSRLARPAAAPEGGALTQSATGAPQAQPFPTSVPEPNGPPPEVAVPGAGEGTSVDSGRDVPFTEDFEKASQDPTSQQINAAYASPDTTIGAPVSGEVDLTAGQQRDSTRDLLLWAGLLVVLISAALLALAWIARRYFADPLLR